MDDSASWVVFYNGTLALCGTEDPQVEARAALEAGSGHTARDFSAVLRPDLGAWLVSYPGGSLFNYVEAASCPNDTAAGLIASTIRDDDAEAPEIVHVESRPEG